LSIVVCIVAETRERCADSGPSGNGYPHTVCGEGDGDLAVPASGQGPAPEEIGGEMQGRNSSSWPVSDRMRLTQKR
jgi:hypothetical protein